MMTAVAGDAAFGVYGVVEDPKSAVICILIALLGTKGEAGLQKAAGIRRGMHTKETAALGAISQKKSETRHSVIKLCI